MIRKKISGIYKIVSKVHPDRCYIGSSVDIKCKRWPRHRKNLRENKHNPILQNHYNKYGEEDLEFIIIEECELQKLTEREQYYIDSDPLNCYFNVSKTAGGNNINIKHSEESRKKRSERTMGHIGWNIGMPAWNKGLTKETDSSVRQYAENGKKSQFKKGMIPWNKGKKGLVKQSQEAIEKRVSHFRGKKRTQETCEKIRKALMGNKNGLGNRSRTAYKESQNKKT